MAEGESATLGEYVQSCQWGPSKLTGNWAGGPSSDLNSIYIELLR